MGEVTIPIPAIEDMEERIIAACVQQLLWSNVIGDGESETGYTVETHLHRKVREAALEVVREQAREAAPDIVRQILDGSVRVTDRFGSPKDETTVRELVAKTVKEAAYNGRTGQRGESVLAALIREEVQKQFRQELFEVIEEAKAPILKAVRVQAVKVFEDAMANALREVRA